MTDVDDNWIAGVDEDGVPCEYHALTGTLRYTVDEDDELDDIFSCLPEDDGVVPEIPELQPLNLTTCPDCKGSGIYQGIGAPEDCQKCNGLGQT